MRSRTKIILFMIMAVALLAAAPVAFAAKVEWVTAPATDDEKAVATAFTGFAQAYGDSSVTQYLTNDVVNYWPDGLKNLQTEYRGQSVGRMLGSGRAINNKFFDLTLTIINDREAEVRGRHYFTLNFIVPISQRVAPIWKLRKDSDSWKIYELDYRAFL